MRSRRILPAVLLAGLLAGCAGAGDGGTDGAGAPVADVRVQDTDGLHGVVLPDPKRATSAALTTTGGGRLALAEDAEDLTLVFFGYTRCPDICHLVMADVASALTRLEPDERARVGMRFVTTDPARDDAETIAAYLERFDPSFLGLTGPLPRILELGRSMGVPIEEGRQLPSGGYEVDHGTQVLGMLPDGSAPVIWTQGTSPDQIAQDIRVILSDGVPELPPAQEAS